MLRAAGLPRPALWSITHMSNINIDPTDIQQFIIDALTDGGLYEMISDEAADLSEASENNFSDTILSLDSAGTKNSYALSAREHLARASEQIAKLIASVEISEKEFGG